MRDGRYKIMLTPSSTGIACFAFSSAKGSECRTMFPGFTFWDLEMTRAFCKTKV